jgi:hypothetical protein
MKYTELSLMTSADRESLYTERKLHKVLVAGKLLKAKSPGVPY